MSITKKQKGLHSAIMEGLLDGSLLDLGVDGVLYVHATVTRVRVRTHMYPRSFEFVVYVGSP